MQYKISTDIVVFIDRIIFYYLLNIKGLKEKYLFKYLGDLYSQTVKREFYCTLDYFLHGEDGIHMNLSNGARTIVKILKDNNISFILEKTYDDLCSHKNHKLPYRYDFCIQYQGQEILIEYDSELHFTYIPRFHKTERAFREAQERDRIKNSYCLAHNIPLYRIPFWDVPYLMTLADLLKVQYKVTNKWHNDYLWTNYKKKK